MPIKSVLQSLSPASGSDASQASAFGTDSAPTSPSAHPSTGSSGGSTSSGSMGNDRSASMPPQAGSSSPGYGSTTGTTSAPSAPPAGTVVAHQGNVDIRTTGIPGVLIAAQSNGQPFSNAAGALLGARQNVHLDGGTKMTVAIANANSKAGQ
jgi:hypothetical protein